MEFRRRADPSENGHLPAAEDAFFSLSKNYEHAKIKVSVKPFQVGSADSRFTKDYNKRNRKWSLQRSFDEQS